MRPSGRSVASSTFRITGVAGGAVVLAGGGYDIDDAVTAETPAAAARGLRRRSSWRVVRRWRGVHPVTAWNPHNARLQAGRCFTH
jgi:hypothetical protein